jgi:hypothetical protein
LCWDRFWRFADRSRWRPTGAGESDLEMRLPAAFFG